MPSDKLGHSVERRNRMKKLRLAKFTDEILPLEAKLKPLLRLAWPEGSDESISGLTVDLSGLWEVSRKHIAIVKTLLTMGTAVDRDQLRELSQELDSNWLSYASDHKKPTQFKRAVLASMP